MSAETTLQANLDAVARARLDLGASPLELAAERLEDARPELIEAMKMLDCSERRELHVRLGAMVNELDALRGELAGGYGS